MTVVVHTREFAIRRATPIDDRRLTVTISSEQPVKRGRYTEILVHKANAVDLSFINSGRAPVLLDHDATRQIGVVESVRLDEHAGVLRATVRFSQTAPANDVLTDIRDGIRTNVSVGYNINEIEEGGPSVRVSRWSPIEVSIVSIPADTSVGVGRSDDLNLAHSHERTVGMTTVNENDGAEIIDLGHRYGMVEAARNAVAQGTTLADFRVLALDEIGRRSPAIENMGVRSGKLQAQSFNLGRFLRGKVSGDWTGAEVERDVSADLTRSQKGTRGTVVPSDALVTRAPMMTTGGAAPLVALEHRGDLFAEALRPASFALNAGATFFQGLVSDISIPRELTSPLASWVAEGGAVTEGNPSYDNVTLRATMLAARVSMTRKALLQGIPSMDDLLKKSINRQFASALDAAVISGSGVGAVPTGIENTVGINSFAVATVGAVTWGEVTEAWASVATDNVAPDSSMAWIAHPNIAKILRTTAKDPGSGEFILGDVSERRDGSIVAGRTLGAPLFETTHATTSILTLGRFSDVLIGQFGGVDFVVDEYSGAATGEITIYAYAWFDVSVRHPQAFCTVTGI